MPRVARVSKKPMVSARRVRYVPRQKSGIRHVKGHGAYSYDKPGPWGRYGRAVGAELGDAVLGRYLGSGLARGLGAKAGGLAHYVGRIFGSGDYVTSANLVKNNTLVNDAQVPSFGSNQNTVRIRHREYLGDVISSSSANTFNVVSYAINPGVASSFPWIANVCGATFQQYRINGMIFEFRTMSSDALNSTNTALGSVVMATDYDSADAAFTSKAQMENTEFGVSCKPSSCMIHAIECDRKQTAVSELYIRAFSNPSNTDIRLYDWGKFYIATNGFQGTSVNCGELWCSYDISLFKAIQQPPLYIAPTAYIDIEPLNNINSAPLGSASNIVVHDDIGLTRVSGTRYAFPWNIQKGSQWMVIVNIKGSSTAITGPLVTMGNGFTAPVCQTQVPSSTTTTYLLNLIMVYDGTGTPAAPPYFDVAASTFPASPTVAQIYVTQCGGLFPQTFTANT